MCLNLNCKESDWNIERTSHLESNSDYDWYINIKLLAHSTRSLNHVPYILWSVLRLGKIPSFGQVIIIRMCFLIQVNFNLVLPIAMKYLEIHCCCHFWWILYCEIRYSGLKQVTHGPKGQLFIICNQPKLFFEEFSCFPKPVWILFFLL